MKLEKVLNELIKEMNWKKAKLHKLQEQNENPDLQYLWDDMVRTSGEYQELKRIVIKLMKVDKL